VLEVVQDVLVVREDGAGGCALLGYLHDRRDVERPRPLRRASSARRGLRVRCTHTTRQRYQYKDPVRRLLQHVLRRRA
jgi:hypothetical protein